MRWVEVGAMARRLASHVMLTCVALVVAAPLLFGPATSVLTTLVGGQPEHTCACGMKRGECGCPECEVLEQQRRLARVPSPFAVLRSHCDRDEVAPSLAVLPLGVVPSNVIAPVRFARRLDPLPAPRALASQTSVEPPTPPPRRSAA